MIICNPNVEVMCLNLRPLYLPRVFGYNMLCSVYVIFHELDVDKAAETVTDYIKFYVDNVIPQKEKNDIS